MREICIFEKNYTIMKTLGAGCNLVVWGVRAGQLAAASVDWSRSSPAKKTPDAAAMAEIASISKVPVLLVPKIQYRSSIIRMQKRIRNPDPS
jgi:hypothetical protein